MAQLLADQLDIESLYTATGSRVDDFLKDAFLYGGKHHTVTEALAVFQRISEGIDEPLTLADALGSPYVTKAADDYSNLKIRRVLPSLLQISDESFDGHLFDDADELVTQKLTYLDPVQGAVGNCYLISAMIALAWARPEVLQSRLVDSGFTPQGDQSFGWSFNKADDETTGGGRFSVSARIPIAGKLPRYARSSSREEYWPALLEKSYVAKRGAIPGDREPTPAEYQALNTHGTFPQFACQALVGGNVRVEFTSYIPNGEIFLRGGDLYEASGVMSRPVMASTIDNMGAYNPELWDKTGLWPNHAYAVLGVMDRGQVVLRNPHGFATEERAGYERGPWKVGDLSVDLNQNGVFAIASELFHQHFKSICWVNV